MTWYALSVNSAELARSEMMDINKDLNFQVKASSELTKSIGGAGDLAACPQLERAPLMHCIAYRSSENVSRQRNHDIVGA